MTLGPELPFVVPAPGRAVLHHPDQTSTWVVLVAASFDHPPDPDRLWAAVPLVSARLAGGRSWVPGRPNAVVEITGDPLDAAETWRRFDLRDEAPARVVVSADHRVAVAVHHAAFDGRSALSLLTILAGDNGAPAASPPRGGGAGNEVGLLRRLITPAHRVAPTSSDPAQEARVWRRLALSGPDATARMVTAMTIAVAEHNRRRQTPWRRVAVTVGLAGDAEVGNTAAYQRISLDLDRDDTASVVRNAVASSAPTPAELRWAPLALRLLAPVANRMGDSFLVSNLGRQELPGMADVVFFPVARGRSAVAIGAVAGSDGMGTVSLRARDLDQADASALLDGCIRHLDP